MFSLKAEYRSVHLMDALHLAYYIPHYLDKTPISNYVLDFKENKPRFVNAWSEWASKELKESNLHFDLIVRALGSKELITDGTKPLDELGKRLAVALNTKYTPKLLAKSRITPSLHSIKTRIARVAAVKDSYYVTDDSYNLDNKNVLIIDDVSTSTATIGEIIRALRLKYPYTGYYFFFWLRQIMTWVSTIKLSRTFFDDLYLNRFEL